MGAGAVVVMAAILRVIIGNERDPLYGAVVHRDYSCIG
jgi:hypothetical protein